MIKGWVSKCKVSNTKTALFQQVHVHVDHWSLSQTCGNGYPENSNTVKAVLSDTCVIHFPVLSDIDFHELLAIFSVFNTV